MAVIRAELVARVETAAGGALAVGQAQELLERALIWNHARNAHQVHRHLAEHPDTFTAPDPFCPLPVSQLLRLLVKAGHGDRIALLACARCGRTDKYLHILLPEGRACDNCRAKPRVHKPTTRSQLPEVQADLVTRVEAATGGALSPEQARAVLEKLPAFSNAVHAHAFHRHLAGHADAFTNPDPRSPLALAELLRLLHQDGYPVTLLACAGCGRTNRRLDTLMPDSGARACQPCSARARWKPCARCGRDGQTSAHRAEGPICARCYRTDPDTLVECAGCGRRRHPCARRADGSPLCQTCAPRPARRCAGCGRTRPITANTDAGPLCGTCYTTPARLCGVCGEIRPIAFRAKDGRPDACGRCYRHLGDCVTCGRHRDGSNFEGRFYCERCYPGLQGVCVDCGATKRIETTSWPIGSLCAACRTRRNRHPAACARCGTVHVLVGRDEHGNDLCGPCTGHPELDWSCRRCGHPGDLYAEGCCTGCVVADRLDDLFDRGDGIAAPQLQPLVDALKAAKPWSVLTWLRHDTAALLAELGRHPDELSHATLDTLPQTYITHYARASLVSTGVLPQRAEHFAQLGLWSTRTLAGQPAHRLALLRPFVEWDVQRAARRRADRGRYGVNAAAADRSEISAAIEFLTWLDKIGKEMRAATQADLERWLELRPGRQKFIGTFLRWVRARRINRDLAIPAGSRTTPSQFLGDETHQQQLRRCLTDEDMPLGLRIAAALVRLYAVNLVRLVELPTTAFSRDGDHAYLTIHEHPVLLPPSLARLIEHYLAQAGPSFPYAASTGPRYLLRGRYPDRPRGAHALATQLKRHDLYTRPARNTAMIRAVTDMPAAVVADLFGLSPDTTVRWADFAGTSWSDYLDALNDKDE